MRAILEIPLTLGEIIEAIGAFAPQAEKDIVITAITTDTRDMQQGDLFIALPGENFDGEWFCEDAKRAKCSFISAKNKSGILTNSTREAILQIISLYKSKLKNLKCTIAITGSVGKSTTKEFLKALIKNNAKVHATHDNYNNYIGLAHTVFTAASDTEYLIAELGTNHTGEIEEMSKALKPDVAIITKIGTSHIGNFGSREMIAKAKLEILHGLSENGVLLIPHGEDFLSVTRNSKTVSTTDISADYYLLQNETKAMKTEFVFFRDSQKICNAKVDILGSGNMKALAFAISCAYEIGFNKDKIFGSISNITAEITRQNVFYWNDITIIDDSFNASLESAIVGFEFMKFYPGRRCAVLGDFLELGAQTEIIHFKIGAEAANHGIELLFIFGVYAPFIARGAAYAGMPKENIYINTDITDKSTTLNQIISKAHKNDVLLFKASKKRNFTELCNELKRRGKQNAG